MFGGYGLYFNNVIFAIIISNELYFKSHPELAKYFAAQGSSPFTYEARGKSVTMSYWKVPIEVIEDEEALSIWFSKSILAAAHKK
jgi:DNA transformation protein